MKFGILFGGVCLCGIITVSATYGECHVIRPVVAVKQVVHEPVYYRQEIIAVPLLIPAFQYQYTPAAFFPTGNMPQIQGQGSVPLNDQVPKELGRDKIKELARALLLEMQSQDSGEEDDGPPEVPGVNTRKVQNQNPGGILVGKNALLRNCAACHTGSGSRGDFQIFTQSGIFSNNLDGEAIVREVRAGRMPPKSSQFRLTLEEKDGIRKLFNN